MVLLGLVLKLTGSGLYASVVLVATTLPAFILLPLVGPAVDRLDRKWLMAAANLVAGVFALGMLWVNSSGTAWIGVACTAGIAAANAFFAPASQAALPNLVRPAHLARANVLMAASWAVMMAIGSALGGLLSTSVGRNAVFVVNAFSFLLAAGLILSVRTSFATAAPTVRPPTWRGGVVKGLAYARSEGRVQTLLLAKVGFGFGAGAIVLLPIFGAKEFSGGDAVIGLLFAGRGLGAAAGPFIGRALMGDHEARLIPVIGASMVLFGAAYAMFSVTSSLLLAVPLVALAHVGGSTQWTMSSYALQRLSPDSLRGRISALDLGLVALVMTVTLPLAGAMAEVADPRWIMAGIGISEMVYAALWYPASRRAWSPYLKSSGSWLTVSSGIGSGPGR